MRTNLGVALAVGGGMAVTLGSGNAALAQVGPDGIDWVTVGAVGNQPWQGDGTPGDLAVGRGSVNYEYKIGRFEVTTSQWVEFYNAAFDRPANDRLPHLIPPDHWGAVATTPNTPGGRRWTVPVGREMFAVGDISWRMAAMYTNWLHNGKSLDRAAFLDGAYDVSTFGTPAEWVGHKPEARYWIPTWDEWLKASHFDPNRYGANQPGWWLYDISRDTPPRSGPPGVGDANMGGLVPQPFTIPLGAYTNITSPWGLFDTAGGTAEWTDEIRTTVGGTRYRVADGSWWLDGPSGVDFVGYPAADMIPNVSTFEFGLRIASAVPAPGCVALGGIVLALSWGIRRRRWHHGDDSSSLCGGGEHSPAGAGECAGGWGGREAGGPDRSCARAPDRCFERSGCLCGVTFGRELTLNSSNFV